MCINASEGYIAAGGGASFPLSRGERKKERIISTDTRGGSDFSNAKDVTNWVFHFSRE